MIYLVSPVDVVVCIVSLGDLLRGPDRRELGAPFILFQSLFLFRTLLNFVVCAHRMGQRPRASEKRKKWDHIPFYVYFLIEKKSFFKFWISTRE